jgi:predicted PurR-regulated permease PerM
VVVGAQVRARSAAGQARTAQARTTRNGASQNGTTQYGTTGRPAAPVRPGRQVAGGSRPRSATSVAGVRSALRTQAAAQADQEPHVRLSLQVAAAYAWRLLIVAAALYVIFVAAMRLELVIVAVFLALVFSSLLLPAVNAISHVLPRSLGVLIALLGSIGCLGTLFWLVGTSVAGQSSSLAAEFRGGLSRIEQWLQGPPFHVKASDMTGIQGKITSFVSSHRSTLITQALSGATQAAQILTVVALAVFCSIFFMRSGGQMWGWFQDQLPQETRPTWERCSRAAWHTFEGYSRGVIIIAATNAVLVGVALFFLKVPLALPLTVLEFFASFIPLAGSPIALAVATVVALAGRGVVTALIVLVLIVVIGQIEGHLLQPLVMGWTVRLHPVVIAVSVITGTILAGVLGAVVAVPLVSITWAVTRELRTVIPPVDAPTDG